MNKSPEMETTLRRLFPNRSRMDDGLCVFCNKLVIIGDFRDPVSIEEYAISGLCQKCQDETFGVE